MSRNFLTPIVFPAGKTTSAPLTLQSGANLTTAAAGAVEYDGKVIYSTPAGRGVSPSMMVFRLDGTRTGTTSLTVQSFFGVGVSLAANTTYMFQAHIIMQKSAGTTSHFINLSMDSSVNIDQISYGGTFGLVASPTSGGINSSTGSFYSTTRSAIQATSATTAASQQVQLIFKGVVSTILAPVLTPSYSLSANPGGAYTVQAGSYFAIWPIGTTNANTSVGPWA